MLIRVSGGNNGIKEYLEEGVKNGRDYTRDELDQRIILAGDLDLTNDVIQSIDTDSERYMHITLSFKEDYIEEDVLHCISEDFRKFIMSAYDDDEYSYYSEAHIPKIKTLPDNKTGVIAERKPHIHIVIPEINLQNGQRLYPLSRVSDQTSYIDSFQEVMNEKYGFASPKVHVRGKFTNESTFEGANKNIKEFVLSQIIEKDIRSIDELKEHLTAQGFQVKERNADKPNNYLNIKHPDNHRGVNLKDNAFQPAFLALSAKEKQSQLHEKPTEHYQTPELTYKATETAHKMLNHWHEQRAAEVRFIVKHNKTAYRNLSTEDKLTFLSQKKEAARDRENPIKGNEYRISLRDSEQALNTAGEHLSNAQRNCHGIKSGIRRFVDRRAVRTVCTALQRCERNQKSSWPQLPERQRSTNPVNQYQQQREQSKQANVAAHTNTNQVRAATLLQYLAQSHGVQPNKYPITTGKDGRDRIICGNRKLNVSDFLTKEMSFSWKEAQTLLARHETARPNDRKQFTKQWQPEFSQLRKKAWQIQISQEKNQRNARFQEYRMEKNAIYGDNSLSRVERKAALSVARMNKVLADMEYQANRKLARQRLKAEYPSKPQEQYQQFESRHQRTEGYIMESKVNGKLLDHGAAPYDFNKENKDSYFITIQQSNGKEKTVWGAGLQTAITKSSAERGDEISMTRNDSDNQKKQTFVDWEINKVEKEKTNEKKHEHTQTTPPEITNKVLDEKLQATRILIHFPKLKELGIGPEHIQKTDKGDKIQYNDKDYSVTQLIRETHSISPKQVNDELKPLYAAQERDQERMRVYKEAFMTQVREPLPRENKLQTDTQEKPDSTITPKDKTKTYTPLPPRDFDDITHKTDKHGNVSYFHGGKEIVVDRGDHVYTRSEENKAVEIGLRLSIEKFGKTLDVQGTPEYKEQITEIAVKNNLKVEFTDPAMNEMMQHKQAQHNKGMNIIKQAQAQHENKQSQSEREQQQPAQQTQKSGTTWSR